MIYSTIIYLGYTKQKILIRYFLKLKIKYICVFI